MPLVRNLITDIAPIPLLRIVAETPGSAAICRDLDALCVCNLPRLASRPWLPLHAAPAPLLPSRSAGRVRASRGSERDSVAPGSRRCCGVFVPTVQLALFRYRSDSEENCPGVLTLGPG